jgi:hypothetical protein
MADYGIGQGINLGIQAGAGIAAQFANVEQQRRQNEMQQKQFGLAQAADVRAQDEHKRNIELKDLEIAKAKAGAKTLNIDAVIKGLYPDKRDQQLANEIVSMYRTDSENPSMVRTDHALAARADLQKMPPEQSLQKKLIYVANDKRKIEEDYQAKISSLEPWEATDENKQTIENERTKAHAALAEEEKRLKATSAPWTREMRQAEGGFSAIEKLQHGRQRLIDSGESPDSPKVKEYDDKIKKESTGSAPGKMGQFEYWYKQRYGKDVSTIAGTPEYDKQLNIYNKLSPEAVAQIQVKYTGPKEEAKKEAYKGDAVKIGKAIMKGDQPPDVGGFGMAKYQGQIRTFLADNDFDLSKATLDWTAAKKHVQTLHGTQQLRLGQAITFTKDSLEIVRDLAKEWQGGQFAPLNSVNLLAARNGAYGVKAASIATRLEAQISDLTSELGTVYKGGNSSTDESLKLAAQNLMAKWDETVLEDNIDQIDKNLQLRINSIKHSGVPTLSKDSIYAKLWNKEESNVYSEKQLREQMTQAGMKKEEQDKWVKNYKNNGKINDTGTKQETSSVPKIGDVIDGYKFKGGNPGSPTNWEKVK